MNAIDWTKLLGITLQYLGDEMKSRGDWVGTVEAVGKRLQVDAEKIFPGAADEDPPKRKKKAKKVEVLPDIESLTTDQQSLWDTIRTLKLTELRKYAKDNDLPVALSGMKLAETRQAILDALEDTPIGNPQGEKLAGDELNQVQAVVVDPDMPLEPDEESYDVPIMRASLSTFVIGEGEQHEFIVKLRENKQCNFDCSRCKVPLLRRCYDAIFGGSMDELYG